MNNSFRIGTRGSKLALWQANHIKQLLLDKFPELKIEIEIIKTTGDTLLSSPLSEIGGKGVFVKEIEEALLSDKIDIAVHSMKDVPSILPQGLEIGAVAARHDPRDAFISKNGSSLKELSAGSKIGTGSLRRASQLHHHFPGLNIVSIRGNVDTRIRKLKEGDEYDAIVLAVAGLERMGLGTEITEIIDPDIMLPAPGQGIVAIEARSNDEDARQLLSEINDTDTEVQATTERAFLSRLGGDCNVPAGCYAKLEGDNIYVSGVISSPDGNELIRKQVVGTRDEALMLGQKIADMIIDQGGRKILNELSNS